MGHGNPRPTVWRAGELVGMGEKSHIFGVRSVVNRNSSETGIQSQFYKMKRVLEIGYTTI